MEATYGHAQPDVAKIENVQGPVPVDPTPPATVSHHELESGRIPERKYPKVFYALKKEFRWVMMTLDAVPKTDHDPTWRMQYCMLAWYRPNLDNKQGWFKGSKLNFAFRFVLWVTVISMLFVSLAEAKWSFRWTFDFPHWNAMMQALQQSNDLILATGAAWIGEHKYYMRWVRLLRSMVQPIHVHNTLVFFIMMWKAGTPIPDNVIYTHFVLVGVVVIDVFMGAHRSPRIMHLLYATLFGATFITWTNIHYHLKIGDGKGNRYFSAGMNWGKWDQTWENIGKAMFGICPTTVPILWTIMYVRERTRPLSPNEYRHPLTGLPQVKPAPMIGMEVVPRDGGPTKGVLERGFKVADSGEAMGGDVQGKS